jgi:hypothetical protein
MSRAPTPDDETARLAELQAYDVLDTPPEQQYDDLVDLAAHICEAPIALISLIDEKRQWFKARYGLETRETDRDVAFCAHAILQPDTFVVEDALGDERFADNPLVTAEPKIRFYAGAPLVNAEGHALGTLCVIDRVPRKLSPDQEKSLRILSRHVMGQLELRRRTLEMRKLRLQNAALAAQVERQEATAAHRSQLSTATADDQRLRDAERARQALLSVLEDQQRIEGQLRASEARYRHLFEQNPAPMLIYERGSLQLLAVNEAFSQHYGYSHADAVNMVLTDLYPIADRAAIKSLAGRLEGYAYAGEWHHRRRDGSEIVIVATSHDTLFEGRQARIAVITDITERKQAERALQDSEELLAEAQALAHLGNWNLDIASGRATWSDEEFRLLGYAPGAVTASSEKFLDAVHPDDRELVVAEMQRAMDPSETRPYHVVHRVHGPNGVRIVEERGRVVFDEAGAPLRMHGTTLDITARHQAEEEARRLNRELEERVALRTSELEAANRELETFTYSVSHDLKAPLRGIDGYSRLLLEDHLEQLDEEGQLFLHNVRQGVARTNQLIEDLLAYSRMERRSMDHAEVDLRRIIDGIVREHRDTLAERHVELHLDLAVDKVRGDSDGLTLALRNLLDNALKFSRDAAEPRIDIVSRREGPDAIIEVSDNGIGFDMRFHDQIFEIFQRLQRAEDYPGTGIGLAIVRKAVQRMGGRIHARSSPGKGASFTLVVPE